MAQKSKTTTCPRSRFNETILPDKSLSEKSGAIELAPPSSWHPKLTMKRASKLIAQVVDFHLDRINTSNSREIQPKSPLEGSRLRTHGSPYCLRR